MLYLLPALAVLILAAILFAANFLINTSIRRQPPLPPHDPATLSPFWLDYVAKNNAAIAELDTLPHEKLTLSAHDGIRLFARFFPAEGDGSTHDTVIVVHGYRSGTGDFAMMLPWYRRQGFNCLVVLTAGTNTPLDRVDTAAPGEEGLLWMRNKWLLCHPDSPQAQNGAFIGITGENLKLSIE